MRSVGRCPLSIVALRYFDGLTRGLTPVRVGSGYDRFCRHIPPHAGTGISFGLGWPCELRRPADTTREGGLVPRGGMARAFNKYNYFNYLQPYRD